jgi:hypothetical protein
MHHQAEQAVHALEVGSPGRRLGAPSGRRRSAGPAARPAHHLHDEGVPHRVIAHGRHPVVMVVVCRGVTGAAAVVTAHRRRGDAGGVVVVLVRIVFQTGQARWAGPGTTRESTA